MLFLSISIFLRDDRLEVTYFLCFRKEHVDQAEGNNGFSGVGLRRCYKYVLGHEKMFMPGNMHFFCRTVQFMPRVLPSAAIIRLKLQCFAILLIYLPILGACFDNGV